MSKLLVLCCSAGCMQRWQACTRWGGCSTERWPRPAGSEQQAGPSKEYSQSLLFVAASSQPAASRATHSDWFVAQRAGRTWSLHCGHSGRIRHSDFKWFQFFLATLRQYWMTFDCTQDRNYKCPIVPACIPQCSGEARWPGLGSLSAEMVTNPTGRLAPAPPARPSTASCCQAAGDTLRFHRPVSHHTPLHSIHYTGYNTHTTLFTDKGYPFTCISTLL